LALPERAVEREMERALAEARAAGDAFNRSRIATVVCVPLTSNERFAEAPGNVRLPARSSGLPKDSVANVSQVVAVDRALLTERVGRISKKQLELVFTGLDIVLGR
jgi:mRNA interferase MazF